MPNVLVAVWPGRLSRLVVGETRVNAPSTVRSKSPVTAPRRAVTCTVPLRDAWNTPSALIQPPPRACQLNGPGLAGPYVSSYPWACIRRVNPGNTRSGRPPGMVFAPGDFSGSLAGSTQKPFRTPLPAGAYSARPLGTG